jgi:hypothetical protein
MSKCPTHFSPVDDAEDQEIEEGFDEVYLRGVVLGVIELYSKSP